jgi:hypothetical protein
VESFFNLCYSAGPLKCAFYSEDGVDVIRQKYVDFFQVVKDDPISIPGTGKYGPSMVTFTDAVDLVRISVYSPSNFPLLAQMLHELLEGNISNAIELKRSMFKSDSCPLGSCRGAEWTPSCYDHKQVSTIDITEKTYLT